jgi:regulator of sirC expression with transglutaminase-like and TPR domain
MDNRLNKRELNALISLLDDPDEGVFNEVSIRFLSLGEDVIPILENAWENSFDTLIQNRIEGIIHQIQFERIKKGLQEWMHTDEQDLLRGTFLIAKYQYPDLEFSKIEKHLHQIKQDVWLELNDNLTAMEKVKIVNHILFDVHHFSGNTTNYHAPQNSYINNVLESKKGNPLLLSIVYLIVSQSLGVPVYGVNLPEHFILCYLDANSKLLESKNTILFYINPFSKGSIFGKPEVDAFLKQLRLEPRPLFYEPCSNKEIVKRLLRNLIASYEKLGYPDKSKELKVLLEILE